MKIALATIGSRGDIQPYIALASELKKKGHIPFIVTHPWAKSLIESYGIKHVPAGEINDINYHVQKVLEFAQKADKGLFSAINFLFDNLRLCHNDFLRIFKNADLIIGHGVTGSAESEILNKPFVISTIEPMGLPTINSKSGNPVKDLFINTKTFIFKSLFGKPYFRYLKDIGVSRPDFEKEKPYQHLALLITSPLIQKRDKLWKPVTEITGFCFIDSPQNYSPDPELERFIELNNKPILITFGSMYQNKERALKLYNEVVKVVKIINKKIILLMPDIDPGDVKIPESIFLVKNIPYPYLLKKVSLVVHHFGFGTTAEVLKAGLPAVPVPFIFDQIKRAKDLYKLGLNHKPLNLKTLNFKKLASAINSTLQNENILLKTKEFGEKISKENGVKKAVELINKYFNQ